ncbi:MAG: LysR family transcriptional regulator [Actinomycetia bacterium]|nr:LysR family transcriptional regulator [Actinomycetes bacterium]MCP4962984.1 LysR family transcriptional regulator [Actinomycetes bacterium]
MSLERIHLQLLAAIKQYGRLGDAARALHLSASAASHRMAEAEKRMGTALTVPHGRTIRLTAAGEHLADHAAEIERDWERAELSARWIGGGELKRIRVAIGFYDTAGWLIDAYSGFPDSPRLELLRYSDAHLLDAVRNGDADLAVAPRPTLPSGLHNVVLSEDVLVAAVPEGSELASAEELTPAQLYEQTFFTSDYQPTQGFEFREFFLQSGMIPTSVIQIQSLEVMLRLVGAGHGVTIQPSLVLAWNRPHDDVRIVPLADRPIALNWTATHGIDAPTPVGEATDMLAEVFSRHSANRQQLPASGAVSRGS